MDVGFAAEALRPPLAEVMQGFPRSRYVFFGFGDRRYLLAKNRGAPTLLEALWPGAALILVTTLAPCWYCTGLIFQFRFKQVIVGDAINAQGGSVWLREKGFDIVDLASAECIDMMRKFKLAHPELWDECIGDG